MLVMLRLECVRTSGVAITVCNYPIYCIIGKNIRILVGCPCRVAQIVATF